VPYNRDSGFQGRYDDTILIAKLSKDLDALAFITKYSKFLVRDARDKVYGLLCVLPTSSSVLTLQFDYEHSVANIYADTIITVVQKTQRLDFLGLVIHPLNYNGGDGFKSWIIRWDDYPAGGGNDQ
jgi:hypothetical protein